jgi:hypothetical protein
VSQLNYQNKKVEVMGKLFISTLKAHLDLKGLLKLQKDMDLMENKLYKILGMQEGIQFSI